MATIMINCDHQAEIAQIVDKITSVLNTHGFTVSADQPSSGMFILHARSDVPAAADIGPVECDLPCADPCSDPQAGVQLTATEPEVCQQTDPCAKEQAADPFADTVKILNLTQDHAVAAEWHPDNQISELVVSDCKIVSQPDNDYAVFTFGGCSYKYPVWKGVIGDSSCHHNAPRAATPSDIRVCLQLETINKMWPCILSVCQNAQSSECIKFGQDLSHMIKNNAQDSYT